MLMSPSLCHGGPNTDIPILVAEGPGPEVSPWHRDPGADVPILTGDTDVPISVAWGSYH